ncbi:DUF1489 domain-containing protein [Pyruvatibacter sp.]|uniref:DUF1489 family protein n=1 Tax=Pyruvatibacter sp. TaxID=1981328 RepID=UPI0032EC1942
MTLHLIKLCVGATSIEDLADWQALVLAGKTGYGKVDKLFHTTRMTPKRGDELLNGGSLYWVMAGTIRVRQKLLDIEGFTDSEGIKRCRLVLDPPLIATRPAPRRPFQGWRYLEAKDAPVDLGKAGDGTQDMPPDMQAELLELGLL